jgi:putative addiction module component (TIGR02574 family)
MSKDAAAILEEALTLPSDARAALAGSLLDSLDSEVDVDASEAWKVEIRKRVSDLDSGTVSTLSWPEVRARLATRSADER